MDYIKVTFTLEPLLPAREILYADIDALNFESIVDTDSGIEAFIPVDDFEEKGLDNLMVSALPNVEVKWEVERIERQNWNANWESQFEPIIINEKCIIRAPFHTSENVEFDIVISPKMSFGTGHHETTYLMSQHLFALDNLGDSLLDMGCGTGVLAIIAKKLNVLSVFAVDIEDWAYENSIENCQVNNTSDIEVALGDVKQIKNRKFNTILANINRNILLQDMADYTTCLLEGGNIMFSGFYTTDLDQIKEKAMDCGLKFVTNTEKNNWTMAHFVK